MNNNLSFNVLSTFVVTNADTSINIDATMEKFAGRLVEYDAAVSLENETIANAVSAVFDRYPNEPIKMDTIVSFALPALNVTPDTHPLMTARVQDYIRANSDRREVKAKDGSIAVAAEAPRTRKFTIIRGLGGGVRRWSDMPVKPTI